MAKGDQTKPTNDPPVSFGAAENESTRSFQAGDNESPRSFEAGNNESPRSFEAAVSELERIVAVMEGGELPLEQSLAAYSRGAQLLKYCQAQLAEAQQRVRILEDDTLKLFSDDNHQR